MAGAQIRARWLLDDPTPARVEALRVEVALALRAALPGVEPAPRWEAFDPGPWLATRGERVIRIPGIPPMVLLPGVAFGDGTHPTTRRALTLLAGVVTPGARILDVGSGSGLLSVAAALLGAAEVRAVEMDPAGVRETQANARRNGVGERVHPRLHRVTPEDPGPLAPPFDGIVANLEGPVLLPLLPRLRAALAPGGWLLLSGLNRGEEEATAQALGVAPGAASSGGASGGAPGAASSASSAAPGATSAVDEGWVTLLYRGA